jgi:hypothetical protein
VPHFEVIWIIFLYITDACWLEEHPMLSYCDMVVDFFFFWDSMVIDIERVWRNSLELF